MNGVIQKIRVTIYQPRRLMGRTRTATRTLSILENAKTSHRQAAKGSRRVLGSSCDIKITLSVQNSYLNVTLPTFHGGITCTGMLKNSTTSIPPIPCKRTKHGWLSVHCIARTTKHLHHARANPSTLSCSRER